MKNKKQTIRRVRSPHHLKKMYAAWRARVLRHEHSLKRAHHQHTSYPMLAMLLLVGGLLLVPSTGTVLAANDPGTVTISAVVSGPAPTVAATIDTPKTGDAFTSRPITVGGTCPLTTYVQLFRNNVPSGTALCSSAGTYSLATDLFNGANDLIVRVYNYADVAGPDSQAVTVTYTAPVVVPVMGNNGTGGSSSGSGNAGNTGSAGSTGSTGGTAPTAPLLLKNDYAFTGYYTGQPATWKIGITGGSAPYSVNVKWGDGQENLYTSKTADTLSLTHTYGAASNKQSGYVISISASDADGNTASLQTFAIVNDMSGSSTTAPAGTGGTTGASTGTKILGTDIQHVVFYVWTTYGSVCLAVFGFWLGEVRELRLIKTRFRLTKV